ncbi:lysosomal-associated transmembrane protein 4B isoform X1 [Neocloeon triangulifer]|uniref:lysosomal-associated transmembrane protein 4B isoform X1 n=1 Tax=Neocloeon triangulifer TaxID=2078957 RepID=UPI00286FA250|nr:lysosomal-associated transmembrane protein 4B isoform X1 [Neocloeon triangulifer]
MIRIKDDRREDWICFFCCHVRTATISIGIWQLMLQVLSLVTMAVMVSHPELVDNSKSITVAPADDDSLETPLPTPLSRTPPYSRDPNMNTQINLIAVASTIALIYGAAKGRPFYLLPYFCLKVFDFCLAVVIAISYLCALPSLTALARQAEEQGNELVKKQLHNMNPSALGFVTILALVAALYIKLYLLSVIWRCYRYLTLRRMSGRATVSVLGAAGLAELGPDYDLHPAAAAAVAASVASTSNGGNANMAAAANVALLNPPEYSKIVKEPPPMMPPRPETPPPPYSSTLNLNQAATAAPAPTPATPAAQQ